MLAHRKRQHGKGDGVGGGGGAEHANGVLAAGRSVGGKLGGGYFSGSKGYFPFFQGAVGLTKITQVAHGSATLLALNDNGEVFGVGGSEDGNGLGGSVAPEDPTHIPGGIRLYQEESLSAGKPPEAWLQRAGPFGPQLPSRSQMQKGDLVVAGGPTAATVPATWSVAAVDSAAAKSCVLTTDGRALTFGSNTGGGLGNGTEGGGGGPGPRAAQELDHTTLSAALSTAAPIVALPIVAAHSDFGIGAEVLVEDPTRTKSQAFTLTANYEASKKGTSFAVVSQKPAFAFPAGSFVRMSVFPQFAPWWVQTAGPPQVVLPGETNILKGIKAIACGAHVTFFLLENGEVWYCGSPAGGGGSIEPGEIQLYAAKDPVFTPEAGNEPIAIVASKAGYLLLLKDHTVRFVGNNGEYMAGNGEEASKSTSTREVLTPCTGPGVPAKDVVAIAIGEYSIKVLKSPSRKPETDGTCWTAGSNEELQQGLGNSETTPTQYLTEIKSLHEGENAGRHVVAISSDGEERGTGRNGSDQTAVLLDDATLRVWGWDWDPSGGPNEDRWAGNGTLAKGNTVNASTPVKTLPIPPVTQVSAGCVSLVVVVEPGAPPVPSIVCTPAGAGSLLVKWREPSGAEGSLPIWRHEEAWEVILKGESGAAVGHTYNSGPLPANAREQLFTGLVPGTYNVKINATHTSEQPAVTGGPTLTAVGGKVTIPWANPVKAEPGWIVELRRVETFVNKKGVEEQEAWNRYDAAAAARTLTVNEPPQRHELTGTVYEARVLGAFEGSWGYGQNAPTASPVYKSQRNRTAVVS